MHSKTLRFPVNRQVGEIVISIPTEDEYQPDFERLPAIGEVSVPINKRFFFSCSNEGLSDQSFLKNLDPDAFSYMGFLGTKIKDSDVANLLPLTGLETICLCETEIGDEALKWVREFHHLSALCLLDTRVTDNGLAYLTEMTTLRDIKLLGTKITDGAMIHLKRIKGLTHIDLMDTSISDSSVGYLKAMTDLRYLRIHKTNISESGYAELKTSLPECGIWYHRSNDLH